MYSDVFEDFFERLIIHEGGYVNNPADTGGETKYGITVSVARQYGYTGKMKDLSLKTAKNIYYKLFWQKYKCDELPFAISWQFFDAAVNHGASNAARMLQRAANVADDGIIGKITLAAVNQADQLSLAVRFNVERLKFYAKLKNFNTFGRGWVNRVVKNIENALIDVG